MTKPSAQHAQPIAIIGGGFTGLSAATYLAQAGVNVVLIEQAKFGDGASGRNGGQMGTGQRAWAEEQEEELGLERAKALFAIAEDAKRNMHDFAAEHGIDIGYCPGQLSVIHKKRYRDDYRRHAAVMAEKFDYPHISYMDREETAQRVGSSFFHGGIRDTGTGHIHPMKLVIGTAKAAAAAGAVIHEGSCVHHVAPGLVQTADGRVKADHVILAGNGYLGTLDRKVLARVIPINNFVIATEPLGAGAAQVLTEDVAVADSRFVVNYFRLSHDRRLLFGGGESYGYRFPKDIAAKVRRPMAEIFPHLKDVRIDYAWGGTLAITMKRLPFLARVAPGVLSASGYSGHGVGTATHAGWLMARAIMGEQEGFETMSALPAPAFPGGGMMRTPLLTLAMSWYALRDRLGI
ncbi:NAD(P)/FAD-dependent oxidoreductase [Marinovum algicola]|uniref:NAD(P)/FAD-dependent oxidoreductase n=1 Tax=Marinovum algicola TaxID=42444 RepID=UPI0024BA7558|nr:FAD-binding oxidoreductase [Marinovum algicola]